MQSTHYFLLPPFDVVIRSWPVVVKIVPLLDSVLPPDACAIAVADEIINSINFRSFFLQTLPCYTHKDGGTKLAPAVFCTKDYFHNFIISLVHLNCTQLWYNTFLLATYSS